MRKNKNKPEPDNSNKFLTKIRILKLNSPSGIIAIINTQKNPELKFVK